MLRSTLMKINCHGKALVKAIEYPMSLPDIEGIIKGYLAEYDNETIKKQLHTARRIY
jgi:hypothetical protein